PGCRRGTPRPGAARGGRALPRRGRGCGRSRAWPRPRVTPGGGGGKKLDAGSVGEAVVPVLHRQAEEVLEVLPAVALAVVILLGVELAGVDELRLVLERLVAAAVARLGLADGGDLEVGVRQLDELVVDGAHPVVVEELEARLLVGE